MKIAAVAIVVLALVVGIVPQYTDCLSQGKSLALANGSTVPMKCHWSSMASLGLVLPLMGLAGGTAFSRRKETYRLLAIMGVALGAVVVLIPNALIGVCASSSMLCNSVMKPTLTLAGLLLVAISVFVWLMSERRTEELA